MKLITITAFLLFSIGMFFLGRECSSVEKRDYGKVDEWYADAVDAVGGDNLSYQMLAGTWRLSEESIEKLRVMIDAIPVKSRFYHMIKQDLVTPYSLAMMLSGRCFMLYNKPALVGVVDRWPAPRAFGGIGPCPSELDLLKEKDENVDPRSVGYGIDLPAIAATWEIRTNLDVKGSSEKSKNWLIVRTELNPDIWEPLYYAIKIENDRLLLRRKVTLTGDWNDGKVLEWVKVNSYMPAKK